MAFLFFFFPRSAPPFPLFPADFEAGVRRTDGTTAVFTAVLRVAGQLFENMG